MSLVHMNIIMAFTMSLMGSLMYLSHLMFSLLCPESMVLSLFILAALTTLNSHFTLASMMPITLLVFAACEAALMLALSVMVSNKYGTDYMQNLNLLQC